MSKFGLTEWEHDEIANEKVKSMSTKNDGGPAFPVPDERDSVSSVILVRGTDGMTLRDYFAAQAMPEVIRKLFTSKPSAMADLCYEIADAMLAERVK